MTKQRNVLLLGSGAVIDWGGSKTICDGNELTFLPEQDT
jgi:hypothetical protein